MITTIEHFGFCPISEPADEITPLKSSKTLRKVCSTRFVSYLFE